MINQFDWASKWAVYSPQKVAFKEYETGRTLTFRALNRVGNRLSNRLTNDYGIKKGDRVAVLAENCLEYLVLFVAAQKMGCILVPINYRLAGAEVDYLLENADPKLLIFESKFTHKVSSAARRKIPFQMALNDLSMLCDPGVVSPGDEFFESELLAGDDPIFILYTSGTTGFPKGALYTHKMLFWNSMNTALSLTINSESRTVNCMPPFHTGGWNVLTTPLFHHGGYSCLMKSFDAGKVLTLIEREEATIFMGVPTMLKMMADLPEFNKADLRTLYYVIVGGEPMPLHLIEKWHQKKVPVRQGYGMTEVGPNLTSLHQRDAIRKMGSIGLPNFYVESKIVDDSALQCTPSRTGELLLRGPMVTPGYWKNPAATESAFSKGWFKTGDRVREDEEGYLFVVDRIKNMYISGGENVYPAEVERVLLAHPNVNEAVVVGVPDEDWGEVGSAFIVLNESVPPTDLLTHCRSKLAKFKVPKSLVILESLPKNDTGKINRSALKSYGI